MVKPAFLRTNNGAWMNRELYTIPSAGSYSEHSTGSGEVEKGIERLLRVPSEGESAVIPRVLGRSNDSADEVDLFRKESIGEEVPGSMLPALNKSTDTDSAEYNSGWSQKTESLSEDSIDEIFVLKKELSANALENDRQNCSDSSPQSSSCDKCDSSTDSASSGSQSRSTDSDRSSSQSSSTSSASYSSDSENTSYTSDASNTYESSRVKRKAHKRKTLDNTPAGVLALQRRPSVLTDSDSSSRNLRLTLDNVNYVASFDQASTNCDLSTLDEPISKELATGVFFPVAIPTVVPFDTQSEISSIDARGREVVTSSGVRDLEAGVVESHGTGATCSEKIAGIFRAHLAGRSKIELFFLSLIFTSTIALVLLLAVLLSQL